MEEREFPSNAAARYFSEAAIALEQLFQKAKIDLTIPGRRSGKSRMNEAITTLRELAAKTYVSQENSIEEQTALARFCKEAESRILHACLSAFAVLSFARDRLDLPEKEAKAENEDRLTQEKLTGILNGLKPACGIMGEAFAHAGVNFPRFTTAIRRAHSDAPVTATSKIAALHKALDAKAAETFEAEGGKYGDFYRDYADIPYDAVTNGFKAVEGKSKPQVIDTSSNPYSDLPHTLKLERDDDGKKGFSL